MPRTSQLKRGEPDSDVFCMVCMAHRKDDCAGLTGDLADVCAMPLGTGLTKCYVNACVAELSRRAAAGCPVQYSPLRRRALKVAAQPGAARGAPEVTEAELTALLEAAGMEHWRVRGNLHTIPGQRAVGRKITRSTAEAVWSASDGHAAAEQLVECTRAGYYAQFQMPLDALDLGGAPASVRRLIEGMVARRAREPRNRAWGGQRVLSLVRTTMFLLGLLTCWTGWHLDPGGAWNDLLLVRLDEPDKNLATRRRAAPAAASSGGLREAVERIVAGTSASAGPEDATGHSGAWWGTLHIAALPAMLRVLGTPRVPEGLWCLHDFKLVAAEVNRDMGGDYMYVVEQSAATSCVHVEVGCMHMVKNCVVSPPPPPCALPAHCQTHPRPPFLLPCAGGRGGRADAGVPEGRDRVLQHGEHGGVRGGAVAPLALPQRLLRALPQGRGAAAADAGGRDRRVAVTGKLSEAIWMH